MITGTSPLPGPVHYFSENDLFGLCAVVVPEVVDSGVQSADPLLVYQGWMPICSSMVCIMINYVYNH